MVEVWTTKYELVIFEFRNCTRINISWNAVPTSATSGNLLNKYMTSTLRTGFESFRNVWCTRLPIYKLVTLDSWILCRAGSILVTKRGNLIKFSFFFFFLPFTIPLFVSFINTIPKFRRGRTSVSHILQLTDLSWLLQAWQTIESEGGCWRRRMRL
jgi:hypothetical protein